MSKSSRLFLPWLAAAWLALCAALPYARAEQPVPPLQARVTDLSGLLTPAQRVTFERRLADFEQRTTHQLAILIVPTTQPESIEQYSIRVVEQWKLGQKGRDNGVLLLVAKDDRELRIEVGYGLEGDLTDLYSSRIIRDVIVPRFKQGDYYGGLDAGLNAIMSRLEGGVTEEAVLPQQEESPLRNLEGNLPGIFVMALIVGRILQSIFSGLFSGLLSGAIVGAATYFLTGSLIAAIIFGLLAAFLGLIPSGGHRGYAGRGGHGWGGGGGFGGGGFRGGGGGFGGGGASGRW
ncbi:MAG: TPM domain-containing protein [Pseudomonadota bacterium]